MAVNLDAVNLTKPDANFKADPKARGDVLTTEIEEDEALEPQEIIDDKKPAKKAPAKKKAEVVEDDPEEDEEDEEIIEEEEPDEEDEPDEEEEEEEEAAPKKKTASGRIQSLIAERQAQTERLRALEADNERLRKDQTKEEKAELDALHTKLSDLYEKVEEQRALGEYKEAAKLQRELDDMRGNMSRAETVLLSRQAALQQQEVTVFNTALAQIEAVFPELSSTHKDFDQELLVALDETIKGYEANGDTPPDALKKAARRLLRYDPFARGDAAFLAGNPHAPTKEAPKAPVKKLTDIKKNIKAASKQPLDPSDDNSDTETVIDPKKVKPEDWHKLPESVRRKLRGDTK